jgi:hypothetical protein
MIWPRRPPTANELTIVPLLVGDDFGMRSRELARQSADRSRLINKIPALGAMIVGI